MDLETMVKQNRKKPISNKSKHHIGDVYIHNKYKFIVKIIGRGEWYQDRTVNVIKGNVPNSVISRIKQVHWNHETNSFNLTYSTCTLTLNFTRLKAGKVLFG